jgi:hypothetical protein
MTVIVKKTQLLNRDSSVLSNRLQQLEDGAGKFDLEEDW